MPCDAHVHLKNLLEKEPEAEKARRRLGIAAAASAWTAEEFAFHRELAAAALRDGAPPVFLCFAVHPQAPASLAAASPRSVTGEAENAAPPAGGATDSAAGLRCSNAAIRDSAAALAGYAAAGELAAVGETGFDLFDAGYRATEAEQERLFAVHLDVALRYGLPLVLHVRRAMHKIFPHTGALKKLPAVVFHSWPGSPDEGFSFLRRGINAFFSFGTTIMLNHKNAIRSCAAFPVERLLFETDAPFQPLRGKRHSSFEDLPAVILTAAAIRGDEAAELDRMSAASFFRVFEKVPGAPAHP
ncbi:MAG: TatD family hydrolase [Treponema sp.]|jgi:TatD DNase family protein|nr:TatD family hydrolase [Treponema sp.]